MKNIIVSALCWSVAVISLSAAELKVATVDMQQVFKDYYKTTEAEEQIRSIAANNKTQIDSMMKEYNALGDQIKALQTELAADTTSSEAAKKAKVNALNELFGKIQTKEQEIKRDAARLDSFVQDQQMRLRKDIIVEITKTIESYSKGKYTLVLDKTGINLNGTPTLLYSEGLTDITVEVTKQLNASKPAPKR